MCTCLEYKDLPLNVSKKNLLSSYSNTLTLDGRVCVDVGHGSLLQDLSVVLPGWENSDVVVRRPVFIVAV